MRRHALVIALALGVTAPACGPSAPPPAPAAPKNAQWQDVFDGIPEMYVVVRPQKVKGDPVYGNFWKTLMRVAESRGDMGGVTALQAAEGSEEVIVGISRKTGMPDDSALVLRGVPANLDPEKMNDPTGRPLFHLRDARARVHELESVDVRTHLESSLFVLPDRTWVVTTGAARERARSAFAAPFGRPAPKVDEQALAAIRLDAGTFLGRFEKAPNLGPIVRKLRSLTIAVRPGKQGVGVTLQYIDEDAAAWGEMQTKRLIGDLGNAPPPDPSRRGGRRFALDWLKDAKVDRQGNDVTVRADLPQALLDSLPNATANDLPQ